MSQQVEKTSAVLQLLRLLADDVSTAGIRAVVGQAQRSGLHGADLAELEQAVQLASEVRARQDRALQREAGQSALVDVARELVAQQEPAELLRLVVRRARLLLGADMAYIRFRSEPNRPGGVRAVDGQVSAMNLGLHVPDDAGLGGTVLANKVPLWTSDFLLDERIPRHEGVDEVVRCEGLRAVLAIPLTDGVEPFGVLYIAHRSRRHFSRDEVALGTKLGDLVSGAVIRAGLTDQDRAAAEALNERKAQAEAELRAARGLGELHSRLIDIALDGDSGQVLGETAARQLGAAVRIDRANGTVLTTVGDLSGVGQEPVAAMEAHAARAPVQVCPDLWAVPVRAGEESLGTVLIRPSAPLTWREKQILLVVAQAAAIPLLLEAGHQSLPLGQDSGRLLDDLLTHPGPSPRQLGRRARRQGIDLSHPHAVILIRVDGRARGRAATWTAMQAHRKNGLHGDHDGCAVLMVPSTDAGATAQSLFDELSPLLDSPVLVSAAGPVADGATVLHTYREALRCMDAMVALGVGNGASSVDQLGFIGMLLSDTRDVNGFVDRSVGALLDYDRRRGSELVQTLRVYFDSGRRTTYAARLLHVHPNTIVRRLERVAQLLGPDWQRSERLLDIQLALRLEGVRRLLEQPGESCNGDGFSRP